MPSSLVPSTFLKHFQGAKGLSLVRSLCTPWEALRNKNLAIQTCLRGLVPGTLLWIYFWAFLGHRGGTRVAPGTAPLPNPKGTSRKAWLEKPDNSNKNAFHVMWETLVFPGPPGSPMSPNNFQHYWIWGEFSTLNYPWVRPDYIRNSKTINSVSVILWKLIQNNLRV